MKELNYSDISLIPQKCIVESRSECDTSVEFGRRRFVMPVYPSNMKSVVDHETCEFLARKDWFYTLHRFDSDVVKFCRYMYDRELFTSISVGIGSSSYNVLDDLQHAGLHPDYITIDVANAFYDRVSDMIQYIKKNFPKTFVIAGNVATIKGVNFLTESGADAIKVGIAAGSVCITKDKTGFHRPMVSTLMECYDEMFGEIPIIADGGIMKYGDIAKAISLGANMVMAGSIFSGYDESAGDLLSDGGVQYKEYYGSASEHNRGEYKHVEGIRQRIPYKGPMIKLLNELREDLQSSISYGGGRVLRDLRNVPHYLV